MRPKKLILIRIIATTALLLAFLVIMLGAYTRLTDAGLGCPDWPGCYGHLVLPSQHEALQSIQQVTKAWTEMVHRYAAGCLGLLIAVMTLMLGMGREKGKLWRMALGLSALVVMQALLGMWTVTLKLLPVVVMAHLLGGILIFSGLIYICLQLYSPLPNPLPRTSLSFLYNFCRGRGEIKSNLSSTIVSSALNEVIPSPTTVSSTINGIIGVGEGVGRGDLSRWRWFFAVAVLLVLTQIALGGWVSANYAGIACIGFPQCNGQWWPALQLSPAFNVLASIGANYQGGVLDNASRVTIQFVHRLGAVCVGGYLIILCSLVFCKLRYSVLPYWAGLVLLLLLAQFCLGIANVVYLLPLWVAVAHNGVAALLLGSVLTMFYLTGSSISEDPSLRSG